MSYIGEMDLEVTSWKLAPKGQATETLPRFNFGVNRDKHCQAHLDVDGCDCKDICPECGMENEACECTA